ncbi:DUF4345 domain-containing protein [Plastoroseomonas arctica]|uniref:DUF4345 domain-containing protein n=1 Tax=Plastoroseomonas arctica TaxID=1509237 RepID=A0AAF1JV70_9PROT|nr:DUF4345 domain-containing protein [Plastoroseomonas arctica]MBR0653513.1 DUF4345 domain-containing protein [Plastoroseomonas arctica]
MTQRGALRLAVALACIVPLGAGGAGVLLGSDFLRLPSGYVSADSHVRYLSGLLLGIGLGFAALIPRIEVQGEPFRLLTFIVFLGGLARLGGIFAIGAPDAPMLFGLAMELVVTPALCWWQSRVQAAAQIIPSDSGAISSPLRPR